MYFCGCGSESVKCSVWSDSISSAQDQVGRARARARARDGKRLCEVLHRIAIDECGHAELSWAIHRWAMPQLDDAQRAAIEAARADEMRVMAEELAQRGPQASDAVGLPGAQACARMLGQMQQALAA